VNNTEVACRKIRAATTESQVIAAVRQYVATLEPSDLAGVSLHALKSCLVQGEETIHSALQMFEDAIGAAEGGKPDPRAADGMRLVLTTAARRIASISRKKG
jgi:hypothetical protein